MRTALITWLIVRNETQLTVLGTLAIGSGINLITSLDVFTPNAITFYDALKVLLAIPSIYLGITVFRFTDLTKLWAAERDRQVKSECRIKDLLVTKEKFIKGALEHSSVRRLIMHIYVSIYMYLLPVLLILLKIHQEWTSMKMKVLSLFLAACALFGCAKNSQPPVKPIVLGYQEIALYRHLFTAKEKGFFGEEGLTVELQNVPSGNGMIEGLVSGQLDGAGLVNLQVGLTVQAKDPGRFKFVNFQVWKDRSYPDYILTRRGSNVETVKQLEGRTVGLHPGSAVKAFSRVVLQHFNVNLDKVTFIELEPAMMQAAVAAGRVDAVYAMDPVATSLVEASQCKVLVPNPMQYIFPTPVPISGSALSGRFLAERPQDAERVIRALRKAILYLRDSRHDEEIAGFIAKYTPIKADLALKLNPSEYWTREEIEPSRIQALADRFQELGIIPKKVDVGALLVAGTNTAQEGTEKK